MECALVTMLLVMMPKLMATYVYNKTSKKKTMKAQPFSVQNDEHMWFV